MAYFVCYRVGCVDARVLDDRTALARYAYLIESCHA